MRALLVRECVCVRVRVRKPACLFVRMHARACIILLTACAHARFACKNVNTSARVRVTPRM